MDDAAVLQELAPVAARLLDRHLANAKEWFPHDYVPWSRGRDFDEGYQWDPSECPMDEAVRSALFVNLLTEDNLPYYFRTIDRNFGPDHPWHEWSRRWTAEENRHGIVLRDYLTVTRSVDPTALERARMAQMSLAEVPEPDNIADLVVYVTLQELATRISHRNTGRLLDDKRGYEVMARVAGDENLHHVFYRDVASAYLELDPSTVVRAIDRQVREFAMPGTGIPGFGEHARAIAAAGIYDFAVHHDHILQPVVIGHWRIDQLEGLDGEAEAARERVLAHMARVERAGRHLLERRQAAAGADPERDRPRLIDAG